MADGYCAAIHIYFRGIEAQLARYGYGCYREGFVQFVLDPHLYRDPSRFFAAVFLRLRRGPSLPILVLRR